MKKNRMGKYNPEEVAQIEKEKAEAEQMEKEAASKIAVADLISFFPLLNFNRSSAKRTDQDHHGVIDLTAFNTDGFDVTGRNVWIHDCSVWNQDDCIAVKVWLYAVLKMYFSHFCYRIAQRTCCLRG